MTERRAQCSCGQLTAVTTGDPVRVSICHCLACQRRTGSAFAMQARFARKDVQISGESKGWVRVADSGNRATFHFCATCGATVFYEPHLLPDAIAIPAGAFEDPHAFTPVFSMYEERRHPWVLLPEGIERHH